MHDNLGVFLHALQRYLPVFVAGFWLGRLSQPKATPPVPVPDPNVSEAQIEALVRSGQRVEAIKRYRKRTGAGLTQARDAVDALAGRMGIKL